jgi:hypothetical protein
MDTLVMDGRRKSDGKYRDASAQLALCRLNWGQYRTFGELAVDMGVREVTVREWFKWWKLNWGVTVMRNELGVMYVEDQGAVNLGQLRAWVESGYAFAGAVYMGRVIERGHVPWVERDWPDVPAAAVAPIYRNAAPVRRTFGPVVVPDGPFTEDEMPL